MGVVIGLIYHPFKNTSNIPNVPTTSSEIGTEGRTRQVFCRYLSMITTFYWTVVPYSLGRGSEIRFMKPLRFVVSDRFLYEVILTPSGLHYDPHGVIQMVYSILIHICENNSCYNNVSYLCYYS